MKKIYLFILFIGLFSLPSFSTSFESPVVLENQDPQSGKIEGLRLFPNPTPAGNILYITSDKQLTKTVTIYSVLGKKLLFKVLIGRELDISSLNTGVYVIKITEDKKSSTQKLIIE